MSSVQQIQTTKHRLSPPSLEELVRVLSPALTANYDQSSVHVVPCPDLRDPPFHLAAPGLCGDERTADVGGRSNLFPEPRLDKKYSLVDLAQRMELFPSQGQLLGAGAGPFHVLGQNTELAPNLSWSGSFSNIFNKTFYIRVAPSDGETSCHLSPSTDCALMMNLYASAGKPGPVLRITAKGRRRDGTNQKSFVECLRSALHAHYGVTRTVSMGGAFAITRGTAYFHVMPDFPPREELPWKSPSELNDWLTYHDFAAPMTCLSVFHSADSENLGLRMEHTHCFSIRDGEGGVGGGHYHSDLLPEDRDGGVDEIHYEGYFNVAKWIYRIDKDQ